ncbi:hypothetical protein CC1G_09987 [Coprinopsis cinerea okayama7|uniref:Uncharacterized protein n=1 Tax=Coprinopsis cinerea (strain Okayama-7 / 130 / ATCC MYA-4618 / FGSC 9003) TaxID=240176 RepID=A8NDH6_COPC7|nr:hypothetical protein CC1G_09987 [Coprinopsis cinerea okayama7\|eukprot:XP_001832773.1 hypothetical protein CC1G_09987 [Coprinopsis cinerea okayama7\
MGLPQPPSEAEQRQKASDLIRAAETGELEIVPGPSLPSLASLNLTSRDLVVRALERLERFKLELAEEDHNSNELLESRSRSKSLTKRFCYEYLHAIGSTTCAVPAWGSRFCHTVSGSGDVAWSGSVNGVSYTQSSCADVANGGVWVLHNCRDYIFVGWYFQMEGTNAAWGKENLIVSIHAM